MILAGWGKSIRGGHAADILQQAMLPIADYNDCSLTKEETMMCAGGEGEGGWQVYVAQKKEYN